MIAKDKIIEIFYIFDKFDKNFKKKMLEPIKFQHSKLTSSPLLPSTNLE